MSSKTSKSTKFKVVALSVGQALNSIILVLVGMVMARVLTKVDVAAYQQTFLAYRTVAPFLSLGISHGIYYFLPTEKLRIRGRVVDSIVVLSCMGVVFTIFILLGGNNLLAQRFENPQIANFLLWMIPYAIFMVPASHYASVLITRDRAGLAAALSIIIQLLVGGVTVASLIYYKSVEVAFFTNVVISILTAVLAITFMLKSTPNDSARPSFSAISQLVKFSLPLGLASMIATLALSVDRILVSLLLDPTIYAAYAFGAREIPMIGIVLSSLASVLVVNMREQVASKNHQGAAELFRKCAKVTIPVLFPISAFFIVNSEHFIVILYTEEYRNAAIPFAIYSGTVLFRFSYFGPLLTAYGQNWFILWSTLLVLVVNAIGSYFAIFLLGAPGAAWATLLSLAFVTVPMNFWRLCKVSGLSILKFIPLRVFLLNLVIFSVLILIFKISVFLLSDIGFFFNIVILALVLGALNIKFLRGIFSG